jgi:hypothetical protein
MPSMTGPRWLLIAACILACALYWAGLGGPMIFDDHWNLAPVGRWLRGEDTAMAALLPNSESVVFSRPLAMGSFMLTTWLHDSTFSLKLFNLLLHVACGLVGYRILAIAMTGDMRLRPKASLLAAVAIAIWLVHPLHVSTVLYGVQRMALLSALFALLAVWLYLVARIQLRDGHHRAAALNLFLAFPALCLLGVLGKQNAVVAPLLCLAFELAYFGRWQGRRMMAVFFTLSVAVPALIGMVLLLLFPEKLLDGYNTLEFTLRERLLTQPRVLLDYIGMWFFPRTPLMGLYTDGYPVSTSLWSPWTTLPAMVALLAISSAAVLLRARVPGLFAGWFFFLGAHLVESTFLPLEMYYEHRNYLPSLGLMLAAFGVAGAIPWSHRLKASPAWLKGSAVTALVAALAFSTLGRVLVWQNEYTMTEQGLRHHPESIRVHLDRFSVQFQAKDYDGALALLDEMVRSDQPRMRLVGRLDRLGVQCVSGRPPDVTEFSVAMRDAQPRLTVYEVHIAHFFDTLTREHDCGSDFVLGAARALDTIVDAATEHSDSASNKTTMRRITGQLYARAGRWDLALTQAQAGWNGQKTMPLGSLLVRAYIHTGRADEAVEVLADMKRMVRPFDRMWITELGGLRAMLDKALDAPQPTRTTPAGTPVRT